MGKIELTCESCDVFSLLPLSPWYGATLSDRQPRSKSLTKAT
jgi:hypothetical protein